MSKLAHSNQETMDKIDIEDAIRRGNEDLVGLQKIVIPPPPVKPMCDFVLPKRRYHKAGTICSFRASFIGPDGKNYCKVHAVKVAASVKGETNGS